jgi:hypothetical protein
MGYGAAIENVQIGQLARPNQPMPGAGKAAGHFFYFANIKAAANRVYSYAHNLYGDVEGWEI